MRSDEPLSFGPVAPHYDVLMEHVPYDMWVAYYQLLQAQLGVRHRRLLDVCCGTGNVSEILADEGYEVVGFDLSEDMIEVARAKIKGDRKAVEYFVADAADLHLGRTFEGAYSFFDSLNYITDPDRLARAVMRVGEHLEPGGSFVFDLNTAYAFEQRMFDQKESGKRASIRYTWTGDYDPQTRIIRVQMDFCKDGSEFHEVHVQRAHSDAEIRSYLAAAGFTSVQTYESYTLMRPREKSDRVHYAAVKGDPV